MKKKDLRPTRPEDSLNRLIARVDNSKTVAHGNKVATSSESTTYYTPAGTAYRWDGQAIQDFDTRISTGQKEIEVAKARLTQAEADIVDANSRIQAASGDLSAQIDQINANTAKVDQAAKDLDAVETRLSTTDSDLAGLKASTDKLSTDLTQRVNDAEQAAQSAQDVASAASEQAQQASSQASAVASEAENARTLAQSAESKALDAAGLAGSKGKVFYGSGEPVGGTSSDLWIKTPGNTPHIFNGTSWVAVTDKVATDAATSAVTAKSAADRAQADATQALKDAATAASTAQQAQVAAGNAQKTADGKTVVQYGTATPPPNPGVTKGDTYYYVGSDYRIIEVWQWSGTGWLKRKIEAAQLANLDAGYITSGYLDVAKRIQAGSIFADKLSVGIGDNVIPNGGGQAADGWSNFGYDSSGATSNNGWPGSFWLLGAATKTTSLFPAAPGSYRFSVDVKGEGDGQKMYIQVNGYDQAGVRISGQYPVLNQPIPNGVWQTFTGTISLPAGTAKANIGIYSQHSNGVQDATKKVWYTGFSLREMKDGSLIVNGSITGTQINAQSVGAAVGSFVQVKAQNVEVTSDLSARIVNSMTANTKNLVVTESAILQHTTLLGTTVADQLNVTKKLVARDAIVDGTIDAAQINVTGELSAQVVNAMDTATKNLVVTDEAILNRATVVQSLVTPELIAQKIDVQQLGADLVTAGAIQTSTATNTGVKITGDGYKAYDSSGRLAVDLNGKNNLMTGMLQTSNVDDNTGRVIVGLNGAGSIDLYKGAVSTHGSIWYSEVGTDYSAGGSLKILGIPGSVPAYDAPGLYINPGRNSVDIRGSLEKAGQVVKFYQYENFGLGGAGFVDFTVTWPEAFPMNTVPFVMVSPSNANNCEMSWTVKNQDRFGATIRLVNNVSSRGTGYIWARVVGMAFNQ